MTRPIHLELYLGDGGEFPSRGELIDLNGENNNPFVDTPLETNAFVDRFIQIVRTRHPDYGNLRYLGQILEWRGGSHSYRYAVPSINPSDTELRREALRLIDIYNDTQVFLRNRHPTSVSVGMSLATADGMQAFTLGINTGFQLFGPLGFNAQAGLATFSLWPGPETGLDQILEVPAHFFLGGCLHVQTEVPRRRWEGPGLGLEACANFHATTIEHPPLRLGRPTPEATRLLSYSAHAYIDYNFSKGNTYTMNAPFFLRVGAGISVFHSPNFFLQPGFDMFLRVGANFN